MKRKAGLSFFGFLICMMLLFYNRSGTAFSIELPKAFRWTVLVGALILVLLDQFILERPDRRKLIFLGVYTLVFAALIFYQLAI